MPPTGMTWRTGRACDFAGEPIVEAEQRGGRTRPEMAPERRVEGEQPAQPVVLEMLVEHVGDVHQQHAQEVAHVLLAEPPEVERDEAEAGRLRQRHAFEVRRPLRQQRLQYAGIADELRAQAFHACASEAAAPASLSP